MRVFVTIMAFLALQTTLFGSSHYGKILYKKKFFNICNMYGYEFAQKHTQDEWDQLKENNQLIKEWSNICPQGKTQFLNLRKRDKKNLFDFVWTYASDSGEIPSCSE